MSTSKLTTTSPQLFRQAAAAVAAEARDACAERSTGRKLVVAGSLPPLRERQAAAQAVCHFAAVNLQSLLTVSRTALARSYEPLSSAQVDDARRQYATIAAALADKCDVLLCETMASAAEVRKSRAACLSASSLCALLRRALTHISLIIPAPQGRAAGAAASAAGLPVWVSWTIEASAPVA